MAIYYVRPVTGDDAHNGTTWAFAKQTKSGALNISAPGDTICVSQDHNCIITANIQYNTLDI